MFNSTETSRRTRSAWVMLLMLWVIGICFWIGYLIAMGYVLFKWL